MLLLKKHCYLTFFSSIAAITISLSASSKFENINACESFSEIRFS